jgi:dihydrofolate synthase/folylpolyglutamate synthase
MNPVVLTAAGFYICSMTYQQTIDYLYSQLPMFSRIGSAAYKKDLHNTIELCNALDNPENKFKSIHIAGTNGKGSTSHMLAAILQQAGYKTGLYTSPHLVDFRERIKINGEMISQDFVIDFVARTKELSQKIEPSFFELTVAMAFEYFAMEKVDIAVIETGLGGRLDSTNIITPLLSIITNIGYDHMNILGDTLEQIAFEKAGIIKPLIPVVIGEYTDTTKPVFTGKAEAVKAPVFFPQDGYTVSNITLAARHLSCDVSVNGNNHSENFTLDLNGLYQIKNLRTVLCAEGILLQLGYTISEEAEKYALANVKKLTGLHGRWEVIAEKPMIVLDVAHNEDGVRHLLWQLSVIGNQVEQLHIVTGMVKDKDVDKVLSLLPVEAAYYFTNAHIPRALPAVELQQKAAAWQLKGEVFEHVNTAIEAAKAKAGKNDLILVCGSVFLVGEVKY